MAKIYVKEIGWMEVEESAEEVAKIVDEGHRMYSYTMTETSKKRRLRTSEITAID